MMRSVKILGEISAAIIGILIILALAISWRLNSQSMSTAMFTPYLESRLAGMVPGSTAKIGNSMLTWDNATFSVSLHADDIKIADKDGHTVADVPSIGVRLNPIGFLFGKFVPNELIADHPQIWIEHKKDGSYYFGNEPAADAPTQDDNNDALSDFVQKTANALASATLSSHLNITRAVITVHDQATSSDWAIDIPEISLHHTLLGLSGTAKINVTQEGASPTVAVDYIYNKHTGLHTLHTDFADINPSFFAGGHPATLGFGGLNQINLPLTGKVTLTVDNHGQLYAADIDLHSGDGTIIYSDFWAEPRAIHSADITATYDRESEKLNVSKVFIDMGGPTVSMTAKGQAPAAHLPSKNADGTEKPAPTYDMDYTASIILDNWPMDDYRKLWPHPVLADAREWVEVNLLKGKYDHGEVNMKGSLSWNDLDNMTVQGVTGKIRASNGEVHYMDGMPPVTGVSADVTFDMDKMVLQMQSGNVDKLRLQPSTVVITGLTSDMQYIDIPVQVQGPVPDVLRLIDNPPLGYTKALGLKPDDIGGNVNGTVTLHFPLSKTLAMKDVDIKAATTLTDIASTILVPGFTLTSGAFDMKLTKDGFGLKGTVAVDQVPMNVDWTQSFNSDDKTPVFTGNVTSSISDNQWAQLGINVLAASKGPTKLAMTLVQPNKGNLSISGNADMTTSNIVFDMLNWKKTAGIPANLNFKAEVPAKGDIKITSFDMKGQGLSGKGDAVMARRNGEILALNVAPLVMGRTNATVRITQPKDTRNTERYEITGPSLDISTLINPKEAPPDPVTRDYHLAVEKLYTSDTGFMTRIHGSALHDALGWSTIDFYGMTDIDHSFDIKLLDAGNKKTLSIISNDLGKALNGLGLTKSIRDGDLNVSGQSTPENPREITGKIKVGSFSAHNLPVLALLLNAASPFGFAGIITDSTSFSKLNGRFRWKGDQITLEHMNAAGSAVGINVEGTINMASGVTNLNGTIVPFSMVNKVIGFIPLVGDLITGGENQGIFAVAYKINGTLGAPKISVNPISLLTPGFIRNLFFGSGDDDVNEDGSSSVVAPETPVPVATPAEAPLPAQPATPQ